MKINEYLFRGAVKVHTQTAIARHLGITQPALHRKLKRLDRLRFSEFNEICEAMDEKPELFIVFDDPKKAAP